MAKQIRYTGSFQSVSGQTIKFDILQEQGEWYSPGYTPVDVIVAGDQPIIIDWSDTRPEEVFHSSSLTLKLISETNFQFLDLHKASYADVRINVYVNDALYWTGNIDDEAYTEPFEPLKNYTVTLTFNDFGQLNRQSATRKPAVTPGAFLFKHLSDLDFPSSMLTEILTGAVNHTSTSVTKVDSVEPDVNLNAYANLVYDITILDKDATAWDAIEAMFKPLNWHIVQKAGHIYVFDINGIVSESGSLPVTPWSSDSQTLNINEVFSEINVAFSPYVDLDVDTGSDYSGGIYDEDAHPVDASSTLNYYAYTVNGATVASYPYDYTYRGRRVDPDTGDVIGERIFFPGSISADECSKYPADHFDTSHQPTDMARVEMPHTGFSIWLTRDTVEGCPITLGDYGRAFKAHNAGAGLSEDEGMAVLVRSIVCKGDENQVRQDFNIKHVPHYYAGNQYGGVPFCTRQNSRDIALQDYPPVVFSLAPFHIPAGDDSSYLNIKLPLHLSAGPNPALQSDVDDVKMWYPDGLYDTRLILDSDNEHALCGLLTQTESLTLKSVHARMSEALRFSYVPVIIKFVSDTGITLYYSNTIARDRQSDFWDFSNTVNQAWWTPVKSICFFAYYHAKLEDRVKDTPLDGNDFAINSQTIGVSFNDLGKQLLDNIEGQSIPFPVYGPDHTHLAGNISITVPSSCWEIGYAASNPSGWTRAVDVDELDTYYQEELKLVNSINTHTTLCLFKQPEITLKTLSDKSESLEDAESFDVVYTATIDASYTESYDTDVKYGTKTDKTPVCRNLLAVNDAFHSSVLEFTRNGITGTAEALLCSTLYSQYADRHVELTGEAFSDSAAPGSYSDFIDRMVKSNPHLPDAKLLMESCYEDLAADTCEAIYRETLEDTYTPINVDTE